MRGSRRALSDSAFITDFHWLIPHAACQVLPYLFYTYICYAFYVTFVPMQGRDGANSNPEILIGGFTALMCLLFAAFLVSDAEWGLSIT